MPNPVSKAPGCGVGSRVFGPGSGALVATLFALVSDPRYAREG
jgi:hypothetical protein